MQAEDTLVGRVALVTGASRGIGHSVAARLAAAGMKVAVGYHRSRDAAEALCARIVVDGGEAVAVGGDVADPEAARGLVDAAEAQLGPVDVLVSNAGRAERRALADLDVETWDRTVAEHLRAAFVLAQRVIPGMRARGFGRIVLMGSVAADTGGIVGPHYTAAKAGLVGLMHALAADTAADGITVNLVAPALVDTTALRALGDRAALAGRLPVGRLGTPEEVAEVVATLAETGFVTGQTIHVDGGLRFT